MSILTDAIQLLKGEEVTVFLFLPSVNWFYLFLQASPRGCLLTAMSVLGVLVGSAAYNLLTNVNFGKYTERGKSPGGRSGGKEKIGARLLVITLLLALCWIFVFSYSIIKLYAHFGGASVWPEILVGVSILFCFLFVSDLLLDLALSEEYDTD